MDASKDAACNYLYSDDQQLQQLAFFALSKNWPKDDFFYETCERLLVEDRRMVIRLHALRQLERRYTRSGDVRLMGFTAKLIRENAGNSAFVQELYKAFCSIGGISFDAAQIRSQDIVRSIDSGMLREHE